MIMLIQELFQEGLVWEDYLVICGCLLTIIVVGLVSSACNRSSIDGYFLAGRKAHFIPIGLSIFVSNIGIEHYVGVPGDASRNGISIALFEIQAMLVLPILGWIFMPVYIASGVTTMPEYLNKRFGGRRVGVTLAILSLIIYIFTKIGALLQAGSLFVKDVLGWDQPASLCTIVGIAALVCTTGGMNSVIWTDVIQSILMISGTITLTIYGFNKVGGYDSMMRKYPKAIDPGPVNSTNWLNEMCPDSIPGPYSLILTKPNDSDNLPGLGYLGILPIALWYWCADQVIVQRALASKNFTHAKAATVLAGFLKMLPLFTLTFPGLISRILHPEIVGCGNPERCLEACGKLQGCSDLALSLLTFSVLEKGTGLRGFFFGVTLAALSSSMTSVFNSSSTIVTIDIWQQLRKESKNREQMLVGRASVLLMVVASVLWVLVLDNITQDDLFHSIQKLSAYFTPPIAAVFVAAMFWKRATEQGVFFGMLGGFAVGLCRLAADYHYHKPHCDQVDDRPRFIKDFHYLYFCICLFILSYLFIIIISLLTKPIDEKHLHRLMFHTRKSRKEPEPFVESPDSLFGDSADPPTDSSSTLGSTHAPASECKIFVIEMESTEANDNTEQSSSASNQETCFSGNNSRASTEPENHSVNVNVDEDHMSLSSDLDQVPNYLKTEEKEEEDRANFSKKLSQESVARRICRYALGDEQIVKSHKTHLSEFVKHQNHKSLMENKYQKFACDVAALILIALSIFLHVYWSADWNKSSTSSLGPS